MQSEYSDASVAPSAAVQAPRPLRLLLVAPSPPPYGGMALQARKLEKLLRADGHLVVFFPSNFSFPQKLRILQGLPGVRTLIRSTLMWMKLWRESGQAEVVHVLAASWLYFFTVALPVTIVGRMRGTRVVLNYRSGDARRFFRWWGWLAKPVLRLAHVITAPSEFLSELIRTRFGLPVSIVPNILDSSAFRFRQRVTLQPKLVIVRHLEKLYDIESALRAFRIIQQRHEDASLWIAGKGSQEEHLRRLVCTWRLQNVRFLGQVPHQDLPAIYDQCDILLNASLVDNFPGALLEGSAAGLVVVSTCPGGIPYMYENGTNALLVEPGNWQGLADAVEKVLQCPSLALALTKAALAVVQACHWGEVRRSLYHAYGFEDTDAARCTASGPGKDLDSIPMQLPRTGGA